MMMESTCFACHADKEIMTGPSFSEIAERYEKTQNNIALLANHILEGSMGQWDNVEMPSHPNLTVEETEKIAAFILSQGSKKNHRILAGLEGMFQTIWNREYIYLQQAIPPLPQSKDSKALHCKSSNIG